MLGIVVAHSHGLDRDINMNYYNNNKNNNSAMKVIVLKLYFVWYYHSFNENFDLFMVFIVNSCFFYDALCYLKGLGI